MFFKEHCIRKQESEHPKGRTLFVLNVPPYVTTEVLKNVFIQLCGIVSNVLFINVKGFKVVYVVFEKESALEKALKLSANTVITLNNKDNVCLTGVTSKYFFFFYFYEIFLNCFVCLNRMVQRI